MYLRRRGGWVRLVLRMDTRYSLTAMIKPADIFVLSGLLTHQGDWTYRHLAAKLHVPHPVVQRGLDRAERSGLYSERQRAVHIPHFEEFALHALRFIAAAHLGGIVPGLPAAWAAQPLSDRIHSSGESPPVWPAASGRIRGQALDPLHPAAVKAAPGWPELSELLCLLDGLRAGDLRVRSVAADLLSDQMRSFARAGR